MARGRAALGVVVACLAMPGAARAYQGPGPLHPSSGAREAVPGQVVVQFRAGVSAAARGSARGAADVEVVRAMQRPRQQLLRVQAGQTAQAAIDALERDPRVASAQENFVYRAAAVPGDPLLPQQWGLRNVGQAVHGTPGSAGTPGADIHATAAWERTTGSRSVVVAVVDSGVAYDHPDLADNIWANPGEVPNGRDDDGNGRVDDVSGWDFSDGDADPRDLDDHGTHVAGTIGAVGDNGIGVAGVSPVVSLMPVRVLDASGTGTTATVADGFNYAAQEGARVVNASLGGPYDPALLDAVAAHPDTLFVVAAGNDASDNDDVRYPVYPCNLPEDNLVCVAATGQRDGLADFSNFGATSVDLGAPGTNVASTLVSVAFQDDFERGLDGWVAPAPWARTSATAAGGAYSVTDSPAGDYADGVDTSLTTAAPVPMSGEGCRAGYDMRLATAQRPDHVAVETSPDGVTWTLQDTWLGNTRGAFYSFTTPLASTAAPQFVRFRLVADQAGTGDGVSLDNVRLGCVDATYDGTEYGFLDGTSMATPQVAGAAALALSLKPDLDPAEIRRALLDSGDPVAELRGKTVSGRRLNVAALLDAVAPPPPPSVAPPPAVVPGPGAAAPMPTGAGTGTAATTGATGATLTAVAVRACRQSGGRPARLRCTLADAGALVLARLRLLRGGRSVARGTARPDARATLTLRLGQRLHPGRYTLTLVLCDRAGHTRTLHRALLVR